MAKMPYSGSSAVGRQFGEVKNFFRSSSVRAKPRPSLATKAKIASTRTIAETPPTSKSTRAIRSIHHARLRRLAAARWGVEDELMASGVVLVFLAT